jgi:hypothetical protein
MATQHIECAPYKGTTIDTFWHQDNPASVPKEREQFHNGYLEAIVRSDGIPFRPGVWRLLLVTPTKEHPCLIRECAGMIIIPLDPGVNVKKIETAVATLARSGNNRSSLIIIRTWSSESGSGHVTLICDFLESTTHELTGTVH